MSPALEGGFFTSGPPGKPRKSFASISLRTSDQYMSLSRPRGKFLLCDQLLVCPNRVLARPHSEQGAGYALWKVLGGGL